MSLLLSSLTSSSLSLPSAPHDQYKQPPPTSSTPSPTEKVTQFRVYTGQFWSGDPLLRVRIAAFIGELITLKDTPSIFDRFGARVPPALKKNRSWPISPLYSIYIQKKVFGQNKKAQTHLKSFNGRQGGILQSISGVSGASGGLKSQNFDFLTQKFKMAQNGSNSSQNGSNSSQTQNGSNSSQKFKMAQNGSNSSQNGSNSSQTQNGSNSSQTHLKNSKWLKMAQTHLKILTF